MEKKTKWYWNEYRQEFEANLCGHPPWWKIGGIHGCNGDCENDDFPGRYPNTGDTLIFRDGTRWKLDGEFSAMEYLQMAECENFPCVINGEIPDGWLYE